jgi:hypothetical protein
MDMFFYQISWPYGYGSPSDSPGTTDYWGDRLSCFIGSFNVSLNEPVDTQEDSRPSMEVRA